MQSSCNFEAGKGTEEKPIQIYVSILYIQPVTVGIDPLSSFFHLEYTKSSSFRTRSCGLRPCGRKRTRRLVLLVCGVRGGLGKKRRTGKTTVKDKVVWVEHELATSGLLFVRDVVYVSEGIDDSSGSK